MFFFVVVVFSRSTLEMFLAEDLKLCLIAASYFFSGFIQRFHFLLILKAELVNIQSRLFLDFQLPSAFIVPQIRRGNQVILGIIIHISP